MLTPNEIKAKSFVIGRQLERKDWINMSSTEAEHYCQEKAHKMGANNTEAVMIAKLAMLFVIKGVN